MPFVRVLVLFCACGSVSVLRGFVALALPGLWFGVLPLVWLCALPARSGGLLAVSPGRGSRLGLVPVFRLRAFAAGWGVRASSGWGWGFGPVLAVAGRSGG